jgi:hypothetical protein
VASGREKSVRHGHPSTPHLWWAWCGTPRFYQTVTLEIESELPGGFPEHVVRTVTENGRTLKFTSQGFESE